MRTNFGILILALSGGAVDQVNTVQVIAVQPLSKKYKYPGRQKGYVPPCRKQQHAERNKTRISAERTRTRALMLLGGKCEVCGINDSRCLQIDHIAGGAYREPKQIRSGTGLNREVLRNPFRFQLLCANHNWIKRFENKEARQRD